MVARRGRRTRAQRASTDGGKEEHVRENDTSPCGWLRSTPLLFIARRWWSELRRLHLRISFIAHRSHPSSSSSTPPLFIARRWCSELRRLQRRLNFVAYRHHPSFASSSPPLFFARGRAKRVALHGRIFPSRLERNLELPANVGLNAKIGWQGFGTDKSSCICPIHRYKRFL